MAYLDAITRLGPGGSPRRQLGAAVAAASAAISGTLDGSVEADIVAGSKTIIIELTADTWVASGATFNAQRQNIIDGLDSAQSEGTGWNAEVRDKEVVTAVARTSDTIVTITLTAAAAYDITANEVITVTIPSTALTGAVELTGSPTVGISFTAVVVATAKKGRIRGKKRYVVEVDGQLIQVSSISEVESVLQRVRDLANESAENDVQTPVTPKPPRIKVRTGSGKRTTSPTLRRAVIQTQQTVTRAYNRRAKQIARDLEISQLLIGKLAQEQDDEDAVLALLLL